MRFFHAVVNATHGCQCVGRFSGVSAEPLKLSCLSSRQ